MTNFLGPNIIRLNGGLGQTGPSDRNVGALLFAQGYEVSTTFEFGEVYEFNSIEDAEALGLSEATDVNAAADTTALCWMHISEWFRLNPDGKLFVFNGDALTMATLFSVAGGGADQVMVASDRGIRFMGVVSGFDPAAVHTIADGFANIVGAGRTAAQTWVEARAAEFVYVDCVVVEGVAMAAPTGANQRDNDASACVVAAACDHTYLTDVGYVAAFLKTGAVGTVLASIGVRMLSESIGSVVLERYPQAKRGAANYSLTSTRQNRWLSPGLSSGVSIETLTQNQRNTIRDNAIIVAGRYEGYPGIYLSGDETCTLVTDDFDSINKNRIWNEGARRVRRALIPRMNSRVQIDPATGHIKPSTIADWDAAVKRELDVLRNEGEIADYRFFLDPNQDVLATGKVTCKLTIVPQGIAEEIEAEIGFTNPALAA